MEMTTQKKPSANILIPTQEEKPKNEQNIISKMIALARLVLVLDEITFIENECEIDLSNAREYLQDTISDLAREIVKNIEE
jgi:hypothetical protein